jgi:hypothetical protein
MNSGTIQAKFIDSATLTAYWHETLWLPIGKLVISANKPEETISARACLHQPVKPAMHSTFCLPNSSASWSCLSLDLFFTSFSLSIIALSVADQDATCNACPYLIYPLK